MQIGVTKISQPHPFLLQQFSSHDFTTDHILLESSGPRGVQVYMGESMVAEFQPSIKPHPQKRNTSFIGRAGGESLEPIQPIFVDETDCRDIVGSDAFEEFFGNLPTGRRIKLSY